MIQVQNRPARGGAQLALLVTSKEELVGNMIINGSLGCSYYEIVKFKTMKGVRNENSRV